MRGVGVEPSAVQIRYCRVVSLRPLSCFIISVLLYVNIYLGNLFQQADSHSRKIVQVTAYWPLRTELGGTAKYCLVKWFLCIQHEWDAECGDSRGRQYRLIQWLKVAHSAQRTNLSQNWFVTFKIEFCVMSLCSCHVKLNVPFGICWLQERDDFLILSELYIFVDIMKHIKIVIYTCMYICIYIYESVCTVYISNMYIFSLPLQW
jgi:hypothetical protein